MQLVFAAVVLGMLAVAGDVTAGSWADPLESGVPAGLGLAAGTTVQPPDVDRLLADLKSPEVRRRREAVTTLWQIRDPRAVEPLFAAAKDADHAVRETAQLILANIADTSAVPAYCAALSRETNHQLRVIAIQALARFKDAQGTDALVPLLTTSNKYQRQQILQALGEIKDPRSVEPLIKLLDDPDPDARVLVITTLGLINDPRAIGPIIERIDDPVERVRRRAVSTLQAMSGQPIDANKRKWSDWWSRQSRSTSPHFWVKRWFVISSRLVLLGALIWVLHLTRSPWLCAVVYGVVVFLLGLIAQIPLPSLTATSIISLCAGGVYYWLLRRLWGEGVTWWVVLALGITLAFP